MMTQTKHKIFNNKIKMLLLILIWTLIWRSSGCIAAANMDGGDVTTVTTMAGIADNGADEVATWPHNAIYDSQDDTGNKQDAAEQTALKDQLANKSDDDGDDNDDANNSEGINGVVADDENIAGEAIDEHDFVETTTRSTSFSENVADDDAVTAAEVSLMLKQQLIYDFAIKYKQISRVTFFTCKASDGNINENVQNSNEFELRKLQTMEILQRMYNMASATEQPGATTKQTSKTTRKPKTTPNETTQATTTSLNENSNDKSKTKPKNSNINDTSSNFLNNTPSDFNDSNDSAASPKGILIKLVQIDQLINKRRINNNNRNNNRRSSGASSTGYGRNVNVAAAGMGFNYGRAGGAGGGGGDTGGRNSYSNANWLESVLRSNDRQRQIVVLDLGCGQASRKLIEMASNKELFNTAYHWLLIEEDYYAVNRQTPINGNNNNSNNSNNNFARYTAPVANMRRYDNSRKKRNIHAANAATVAASGDAAATSNIDFKTVANRFAANFLLHKGSKTVVANRTQQLQQQRLAANDAATAATASNVDDEQDMEIIEKFLEKINININTELILAKRIRAGGNAAAAEQEELATGLVGKDEEDSVATTSTSFNKPLQSKDYYMLHDVWNPGLQYGGQLNISEIGNFSLDDGLQIAPWYRRSTTITRRMDMKNARIRCLIVITHKNRNDTLEEYLTTHYDTHLDSMNRFNFALLAHVRDLYNFSFILSKTSSWGYLKNGKFDGMIGALTRKQADIGGSPIFFRIERAKVIDYTSRTWVARPCFIFRHPRSTKKDRIVFLQPFTNDVWVFTAMFGIITILLLWALTNIERKIGPDAQGEDGQMLPLLLPKNYSVAARARTGRLASVRNHNAMPTITEPCTVSASSHCSMAATNLRVAIAPANGKQTAVVAGHGLKQVFVRWGNVFCGQDVGDDASRRRVGLFLESVLFYIGSICQQGLAYSTSFFSGRCIVTTSLLFSFAIYQFYSASIVGTLLMEKPKTIRTLRDLIHSSLEIGIEDIVYNRDYFLRTKDPDAIELYAKKVTAVPVNAEQGFLELPPDEPATTTPASAAAMAKSYREILHSHETGAHAKTNEASNWYDPEYGVGKIKKGRFAFHVDVATAYKIISDTFNEKEICDLTEIQLFPPQKMVSIVQKGSPLRKMITYGLRRVTEVGLMDYQRKIWHSAKPRCVKQIHTDDLRVDMQTFTSALLVLIFGYAVSLLTLGLEIMHHKLWQRFMEQQ